MQIKGNHDVQVCNITNSTHTDRTFLEYLLAEYYIDTLLQNGDDNSFIAKRLNIGTPSEPTIRFLDGLLDLILEARKEGKHELV